MMSGAHILIFPFPASGHMIPLLNLTHHLAARGLTVTIVVTPNNLPQLDGLISDHPNSITPLILPVPVLDLPSARGVHSILRRLGELHDPLLNWFKNHPSPPTAIISDMFLGWTNKLAGELGIPRYVFYPSGAYYVSLFNSMWDEMPEKKETIEFGKVPNSPIYPWWQLSHIYRMYVKGDPVSEFVRDLFRGNVESDGVVFNTFGAFEEVYLEHLMKELGHGNVWAVGPLLPRDDDIIRSGEICSWLDDCDYRSVVYVCFGSRTVLTEMQMEGLTLALEKSGVKFIMCLIKENVEGDRVVIISGFKDRTVGRGIVVEGWAPQVAILKHRAVCAFMSHCGWNSVMESVTAGVPILAWPMGADQYFNATLLVDQGVGIRVCEGGESVIDSDELTSILVETRSEKWNEKRTRAMALSKEALDGVRKGGDSFNNLDDFVSHLSK